MMTVTIEDGFRMTLPDELRELFRIGDELVLKREENGQITLTAKTSMQQALDDAFGIWADRTDIPKDGVEFVNQIRSGGRFEDIRKRLYETA